MAMGVARRLIMCDAEDPCCATVGRNVRALLVKTALAAETGLAPYPMYVILFLARPSAAHHCYTLTRLFLLEL